MIEVTIIDTGDTAECDTPKAAHIAAVCLGEEARLARGQWGYDPRIKFTVEGETIRVRHLSELTQ